MFEKIARFFCMSRSNNRKFSIGDKVVFKEGRYYIDSYGNKPYGFRNRGNVVYITRINRRAEYPYHISVGDTLGKNDLGWLKEEQIEKAE